MPHNRERDADSASSSGQSKRPPLNHQESDSQSDTSGLQHQQQHHHRQHHRHQRQHPVGRLHNARAPAVKAAPKQPKLHRRHTSPPDSEHHHPRSSTAGPNSHRRAASDAKLSSRESSSANLTKSPSHSKLKRNRSHVEVPKRSKSTDKLKRAASTTIVYQVRAANNKNQVHFDLGSDGQDQDDEWVDASGSNSPYLSRKGSLNSSAHSSLPQGASASASSSRPVTPSERAASTQDDDDDEDDDDAQQPLQPEMSTPERERAHHKEYLTSRLLQRVPSHGAPPQMSADLAQAGPRQFTPASAEDRDSTTLMGSNQDELTSRFVEAAGSGLTSEGSFYRPARNDFRRFDDTPRKARSVASLHAAQDASEITITTDEADDSALAPKSSRRSAAPPAQASRTQQKLNLQRASSVIEPGQAVGGLGGVVGSNPLVGVASPGYDGGTSRDPRVSKLLERTGLEYLVVRRYQNSVSRSLGRLSQLPDVEKSLRIPKLSASANGKRSELVMRHTRNVSMPDARRPVTPRRPNSIRTNGAASSFDGDDETRLNERLSGSSLVGGEEEDGTAALLRNLWEKSAELSASTD